jgi:hypothetical protein
MAFRGPKVWWWRWRRRNLLRRRADVSEAWVVLGARLLTVLAGALAGLTTARSVESGLARERAEWRPAVALVTEKAPGTPSRGGEGTAGESVWAKVGWIAPDGSPRTGRGRPRKPRRHPGHRAERPRRSSGDPPRRRHRGPAACRGAGQPAGDRRCGGPVRRRPRPARTPGAAPDGPVGHRVGPPRPDLGPQDGLTAVRCPPGFRRPVASGPPRRFPVPRTRGVRGVLTPCRHPRAAPVPGSCPGRPRTGGFRRSGPTRRPGGSRRRHRRPRPARV